MQELPRIYHSNFLVGILLAPTVSELKQRLIYIRLDGWVVDIPNGFDFPVNAIENSANSSRSLSELTRVDSNNPLIVNHLILWSLHRIKHMILDRSWSTLVPNVYFFCLLRPVLWRILILINCERVWTNRLEILIPSATIFGILDRCLIDDCRSIRVVLVLLNNNGGAGISWLLACSTFNHGLCLATISLNDIFLKLWGSSCEWLLMIASSHVSLHH